MVQAASLVKQTQTEKLTLIAKMRVLANENKRLKQIVGELRITSNQSELSDCRHLNSSSRFMLSQRKEVSLTNFSKTDGARRQNYSTTKAKTYDSRLVASKCSMQGRTECDLSNFQADEGCNKSNTSSLIQVQPINDIKLQRENSR